MDCSNESETTAFTDRLDTLESSVQDIWTDFKECRDKLNKNHIELSMILDRYKSVHSEYKKLSKFHQNSINNNIEPVFPDSNNRMTNLKAEMRYLRQQKLRIGSVFLRFIMGRVSMRVWSEKEKLNLKDEYHRFKDNSNYIWLSFVIIQLAWRQYFGEYSWVLHQWHQIWLVYYYLTLAVRESVLQLNGSRIHPWWLMHHHLSSFGCFISVLLMRSAYDRFAFLFDFTTWILFFIGCLQFFANRYQRSRHYVKIAMGKSDICDISVGETMLNTSNVQSSWEFFMLKTSFYVLYVLEISMGIAAAIRVWSDSYVTDVKDLMVMDLFTFEAYCCCLLFIFVGVGNTYALYHRPSKMMKRVASSSRVRRNSKVGENGFNQHTIGSVVNRSEEVKENRNVKKMQ